jgi:(S)-ureidoglycine aminohydrolase
VAARHALIAPDGRVPSSVPGIAAESCVVVISPAMGAALTQLLVTFGRGGAIRRPGDEQETAAYVMAGGGGLELGGRRSACRAGTYFFAPAGAAWRFTDPLPGTQLTLFQKRFNPLVGVPAPPPVVGRAARVKGRPFLGDPDARLQVLLPDTPSFDLAMNIFTYQPGATLPFVETHVMEHGLIMLAGQGVYRLDDSWYPVGPGDAIWMAPYCPQWFVAMGKSPASYLYYKDVNRAP